MDWIRKPRKRMALSLALALAMMVMLSAGKVSEPILGFWGMLYPEYCFSAEPDEEGAKPRFTFRWLHASWNGAKIGEKYQTENIYEIR